MCVCFCVVLVLSSPISQTPFPPVPLPLPPFVQLCRYMSLRTYEEGDWLYTQGSAAGTVYVPLEGTLSVWANPMPVGSTRPGTNDGVCTGVGPC